MSNAAADFLCTGETDIDSDNSGISGDKEIRRHS
jgi:hypothetical protein